MEDARSYLEITRPATEALFKLLNEYGWQKMRAFVEITNVKTKADLDNFKKAFTSVDIAREVISGSILQIAYFGIKQHGQAANLSQGAMRFEAEMNRLLRESPKPRQKKPFVLPRAFCVGRGIGDLPIGMMIYAGRNQYNHSEADRLTIVNEVVFNYMQQLRPNPKNGKSFNIYDKSPFHCWSIIWALGWVANDDGTGYSAFVRDMHEIMQIEA